MDKGIGFTYGENIGPLTWDFILADSLATGRIKPALIYP